MQNDIGMIVAIVAGSFLRAAKWLDPRAIVSDAWIIPCNEMPGDRNSQSSMGNRSSVVRLVSEELPSFAPRDSDFAP